jgi:hypothetical protein
MPARSRPDLPTVKGDYERDFDLSIPILKINKLFAAERDQIEDVQSVTRLLRAYITDEKEEGKPRHEEPISIAVFAPPGAGKSWAVKEIATSLSCKTIEFNVAQFRRPQDLTRSMHDGWWV